MGFGFFSTLNYWTQLWSISCVQRCVGYSCIIHKVQYSAWYERVKIFEKGRSKDNLWDANFRAILKSHCLGSLLSIVHFHGKPCCWRQKHYTPLRVKMQKGITAFSAVNNFNLCLYQEIKLYQFPFPIGSLPKANVFYSYGRRPHMRRSYACLSYRYKQHL